MKHSLLQNIRTRLTLWNILVFGGILALYAFGTSWFFLTTLSQQLNESLKEELELVEQMLFHLPEGEYFIDTHEGDPKQLERFIELWSGEGRLLYRSKMLGTKTLGGPPDSGEFAGGIRSVVLDDGTRLRVASKLHNVPPVPTLIRLSVNEQEYLGGVHRFITFLLIAVPLALLLLSVSAYLLARNALKPIDAMASTARHITAEALHERIPIKNPDDELGRLAATLNDLLGRVEKSFQHLRRFTSDASHQLRTPLTAMRSVGEVGLHTSRSEEQYREIIGSMLEESSRLTQLVDSLLFLSRADARKHQVHPQEADALEVVQETASMIHILAEEKSQRLDIAGDRGIRIMIDKTLFCQAILNLIDNAIKFSPEGGTITVGVTGDEHTCRISVADCGPGIPESEKELVFQRFYKVGKDGQGGTGLGLAIARWVVEANGGTISVSSANSSGSTFLLTFPRIPKP